jgi:hypothetical protein
LTVQSAAPNLLPSSKGTAMVIDWQCVVFLSQLTGAPWYQCKFCFGPNWELAWFTAGSVHLIRSWPRNMYIKILKGKTTVCLHRNIHQMQIKITYVGQCWGHLLISGCRSYSPGNCSVVLLWRCHFAFPSRSNESLLFWVSGQVCCLSSSS